MQVIATTPSLILADFASGLRWEDVPTRVQERVKLILLDTIASALAGHDANEPRSVVETARLIFGRGDSTVIGGGVLSPAGATMANGYLVTAVTVCDVHRPTLCHVTPEVIPPALAIAEEVESSGQDLLASLAAGLEVTTRVGLGTDYVQFRARGWHSPGVTGPFGGAAAAGRLLNLDGDRMRYAFGIAGSQATGSFAQLGTPTIKFSQARGALGGLLSARLAAAGFTAAEEVLLNEEGGLYHTHSNGGDPEAAVRDIGLHWELENISLRPWPVAAYLQTVVSTILPLTLDNDIRPDQVRQLRVRVSPPAYRMHGDVGWEDRFRARLSARYVAAVVVHDRRCWLDQFTAERVVDAGLSEFARQRVQVIEDPELADIAVTAEIELLDGAVHQVSRTVPKGDAGDPLSHAEIVEKFRAASTETLGIGIAEEVIQLVDELEQQQARRLIQKLRGDQGGLSS